MWKVKKYINPEGRRGASDRESLCTICEKLKYDNPVGVEPFWHLVPEGLMSLYSSCPSVFVVNMWRVCIICEKLKNMTILCDRRVDVIVFAIPFWHSVPEGTKWARTGSLYTTVRGLKIMRVWGSIWGNMLPFILSIVFWRDVWVYCCNLEIFSELECVYCNLPFQMIFIAIALYMYII